MVYGKNPNVKLCGYALGNEILFYFKGSVLINFSKNNFRRVQIRSTMANLLTYLLLNSDRKFITDDDIMSDVWEMNNLRASSHRLWQVSRDLKFKLIEIGLNEELFTRVERRGFSVNSRLVMPIYCDSREPLSLAQPENQDELNNA
jgi:DNA-binding winged helix-turn-helix (wHTH) protein